MRMWERLLLRSMFTKKTEPGNRLISQEPFLPKKQPANCSLQKQEKNGSYFPADKALLFMMTKGPFQMFQMIRKDCLGFLQDLEIFPGQMFIRWRRMMTEMYGLERIKVLQFFIAPTTSSLHPIARRSKF